MTPEERKIATQKIIAALVTDLTRLFAIVFVFYLLYLSTSRTP